MKTTIDQKLAKAQKLCLDARQQTLGQNMGAQRNQEIFKLLTDVNEKLNQARQILKP